MTPERFRSITSGYAALRIAIVGDFCLDRYLEIDPARYETSIETGLPVHNVVRVRAQPGGAGTILNNLVALRVGRIVPVSFCGEDGEGYELRRELARLPGVELDHFVTSPLRRTFTYCKPLIVEPDREPVELNRLDSKNWTPTPPLLAQRLADGLREIASEINALIVLEQVDQAETGVVTRALLDAIGTLAAALPGLPILADSRRGLAGWPGLSFKMNAGELAALLSGEGEPRESSPGRASLPASQGQFRLGRSLALPGDPDRSEPGEIRRLGPGPPQRPPGLRDACRAGHRRRRAGRNDRARSSRPGARTDRHRGRRRRCHGEPGHGPPLRRLAQGIHRAGRDRFLRGHPSTRHDGDGNRLRGSQASAPTS